MINSPIPIFYACDDNFVKYTVVSLSSMIKNASKERSYRIYILHTSISEEMKKKTAELENESFKIFFCNVNDYLESISEKLPIRDYYTKTTYFRFFISEMFPEYKKAIYIDSDTVVTGDISRLYDTDIGEAYVGACHEQVMVQNDVYGTYCERVVGISRHNFFNAGLLLINCDMFRKKQVLDKFTEYLGTYNFIVTQDEDYLNLICKDRVFWLDQRWNTELSEELSYPYSEDEAYVLHYIMVNKPWHYKHCKCADAFWKYAECTSVYEELCAELENHTDDMKEKDRLSCDNLLKTAINETNREDNFLNRLNKTKRAPDRIRVLEKIREYEMSGKFDTDVEDDPPSRTLMPDEIDYFRRSPISKIRTAIAHAKAKKFLNYITKKELMIIKEVRGLENFSSLDSGAVVTCNHFNAFDSFAIHKAYLMAKKKKKLYRVIREGNYTSFPGFYGYLMRNFYTLPLSSSVRTMAKFTHATDTLLRNGNFILFYPEQSMWWNYRKPKPLKPGAFHFAAKNGVPILPCFITMKDSDIIGEDGYFIQEYTIHIEKPIYPDSSLSLREQSDKMKNSNFDIWKSIYEREYSMPLDYSTL